jgi:hypothetical protein
MRKPLFESLEEHEWEEVLRKLSKFYTNKDNKCEMDKVCLQFALHRILPEENDKEELEPTGPVLYTPPICNSKSRTLGILELIPDMVSSQKSCCRRPRTVFLLSKFPLPGGPVPEREAAPRLVVRRPEEGWGLDPRLRQPTEVTVVAGRLFVFVVPEQEEAAVAEIYREGGRVFLEAWRPRDKTASNVKIEFELKVHAGPEEACSLCIEDPDRLYPGRPVAEGSLHQRLAATGTARPGVKRRRREDVGDDAGGTSPQQGIAAAVSPAGSLPPEHLFHEIEDFDVGPAWGPPGAGMPDVLVGVVGRESPDSLACSASPGPVPEQPGCNYRAESASLASSDLVDLSPAHRWAASLLAPNDLALTSSGLVESASLLSWTAMERGEEGSGQEEEGLDLSPSLHRVRLARSRARYVAPKQRRDIRCAGRRRAATWCSQRRGPAPST